MPRTEEQQYAIDTAKNEQKTVWEARAGTGKTATAVEFCSDVPNKGVIVVSFNVKNAKELKERLPSNGMGSTAHSFCNKFVNKKGGNGKFNEDKMFGIIYRDPDYFFKDDSMSKEEQIIARENLNSMKELVGLAKNYFLHPTVHDIAWLVDHYDIGFSQEQDKTISDCLKFLHNSDTDGSIDYNDMIRFPVLHNSVKPYCNYFIIDEAQDNTPIRTLLWKQIADKGVQVIAVGDDRQAIYGFAGADCESMERIKALGSVVCPLTINFRCDKNIIREAQRYVPDIQYFEGKDDGEIVTQNTEQFMQGFEFGDVALSRYNKVIIPMCFKFIKEGKKATIQGKDFGKMMKGMVTGFKATNIEEFYERIDRWQERQLKNTKSEGAVEAIQDRFECLKFFADNSDTVEGILNKIDTIFSDELGEGLKLSTVHKSKGLEWNRVSILGAPTFFEGSDKMKNWQAKQLQNLYYVAITRAKHKLAYVS